MSMIRDCLQFLGFSEYQKNKFQWYKPCKVHNYGQKLEPDRDEITRKDAIEITIDGDELIYNKKRYNTLTDLLKQTTIDNLDVGTYYFSDPRFMFYNIRDRNKEVTRGEILEFFKILPTSRIEVNTDCCLQTTHKVINKMLRNGELKIYNIPKCTFDNIKIQYLIKGNL